MKKLIITLLTAVMAFVPVASDCNQVAAATASTSTTPYYADQVYTGVVDDQYEKDNDPLYDKYNDSVSICSTGDISTCSTISWGSGLTHADSKSNTKKSYGIDVSKWQKDIDWTKVAASGVEFAIIRLGYRAQADGTITADPMFETNIKAAYAAGIKIGVYFYTQAITTDEAKAEADYCADTMANYTNYLSFPIMFDIENTSTDRMGAANLSTDQRTKICKAFCSEIEAKGYTPGIYSYKTYLENKLTMSDLESYYVWLANFATSTSYAGSYSMWQYSDNASSNDKIIKISVPGISTSVDLDVAYTTLPDQVANLKFDDCTDTSITAKWDAVSNADGYEVDLLDNDENLLLTSPTTSKSITFSQLGSGTKYKVRVRAYFTFQDTVTGQYSNLYGEYSSLVKMITKPAQVVNVTESKYSTDYIKLSWDAVTGASGYTVYQYNSSKDKYVSLGTTTSTSYKVKKLSKATKYKFKIQAYKTLSDTKYTGKKSAVFQAATRTGKVTGFKVKSYKETKITLTWNKVSKATGYKVYVYDSNSKLLEKYTTKSTTYKVKNLTGSTTYKFKVKAYIKTSSDAYAYSEGTSKIKGKTTPSKVTGITVSKAKTDSLKFTWTKASGVSQYKVYKYNKSTKKSTLLATTKKNSYTMKKLSGATKYSIKVVAYTKINGKMIAGDASSVFTAATKPDKVKKLKLKSVEDATVKLSWEKVTGATGYRVFRYDSEGELIESFDVSKNSCTDENLEAGDYTYKVAAIIATKNYTTVGSKSAEVEVTIEGDTVE